MTFADLVMIVLKIGVIIGFLLGMAAAATWAERRQSAMVQDRVGPNRAVVYVPSNPLRVVVFVITALVAAAIAIPFWHSAPGLEQARMTTGVEVAILVAWFSLMLLSNHVRYHGADNAIDRLVARAEPRTYFYAGLVAHLVALLFVRLVPPTFFGGDIQWATGLAGELAAIVIMSAGFYMAAKLPDGKTELRLAGMLHAIADTIKMIWKEDLRPAKADKVLFTLAPLLAMIPALVTVAVIPFGSRLCFLDLDRNAQLDFGDMFAFANTVGRSGQCAAGQLAVDLQVADLNVGLLFVFAIAGTGIIGAAIAGWASDSKFALMGALRATAQMVSYEVALGLAVAGLLMVIGSVHLGKIVEWQGANTWGIFAQPLGFVLFFTAVIAETKRVPFDAPEGESEIVAGYSLEYSGMKWGMFMTGEYAEFVFASILMVTLFFGGYHLPFLHADGITVEFGSWALPTLKMSHMAVSAIHFIAFVGKTILFAWFQLFIRWTLPRFRYDQIMKLGWTRLLPLTLVNIMLTGLVLLAIDTAGPQITAGVDFLCDLSQALVAFAGLAAVVGLVTWLLEPAKHRRLVESTSQRFASATGGVKTHKITP